MAALFFAILAALSLGVGAPDDGPAGREMALTFDDLPATPRLGTPAMAEITAGLLAALARHEAPAIGFVNEDKLYHEGELDPGRVALLERWLDAGHELGNHTFSHPDLHRVPLDDFRRDVIRGEEVTRRLLAKRDARPRYFRHPFLHTGRDLATRDALVAFLTEHGYRVAPVTIDNQEWIYARAYDRRLEAGDDAGRDGVAQAYLDYMENVVAYYESQSRGLFEREIPQVLLLHANRLNADHLDALLSRLRKRGYRFIPLDHALDDPVYASEDRYHGPGGITWIHRWAITRGVDRTFFRGEPEAPASIYELAGVARD